MKADTKSKVVWTAMDIVLMALLAAILMLQKELMSALPNISLTVFLILLYAKKNTSFILVSSGTPHCGKLVKEYASFYQGKGGGNDVSARAIFTTEENAMLFADLLEKHLR